MYLDLSPRSRWGVRPTLVQAPVARHVRPWIRRAWLYGGSVALVTALFFWSSNQQRAIASESSLSLVASSQSAETVLLDALTSSELDAQTLAARGMALLQQGDRLAEASLYLQAASAEDPTFRDAALFAGATELARADVLHEAEPTRALTHTKSARTYLELARSIDPIHAYTFELLATAYGNLGETTLAADAQQKATLFKETPNL